MSTTGDFAGENAANVFAAYCDITDSTDPGFAVCFVKETVDGITTGLDTFFLLFAGALVFLMQAGFAMLCAGSVRQKNVKNIMLKNLLDACGGAIGFYTLGYGFAYGSGNTFIGSSNFAITDMSTGPEYIGFFFQFAFAATAATIVAGTVAERCKMAAYLCYSIFLTAFVSTKINIHGLLQLQSSNRIKSISSWTAMTWTQNRPVSTMFSFSSLI